MPWAAAIPAVISAAGSIAGSQSRDSINNSHIFLNDQSGLDSMINGGRSKGKPPEIGDFGGDQGAFTTAMARYGQNPYAAEWGGVQTQGSLGSDYQSMHGLVDAGPGQQDVTNSLNASRSFADMLKQYSENGGAPGQQDIDNSNGFTNAIFGSRQTGLNQSFIQQNTEAERLAARLGRPVNDPIIQAKLRTGFMNQQDTLNADKTSYSAQYANQLSQNRLGYANQRSGVLSQLATQAFSNRAAILSMGSQLGQQERQWRFSTSDQMGTQQTGGGLAGAVSGGIAGLGAGASIASNFGGGTQPAYGGTYAPNSAPTAGSSAGLGVNTQLPAMPSYSGASWYGGGK